MEALCVVIDVARLQCLYSSSQHDAAAASRSVHRHGTQVLYIYIYIYICSVERLYICARLRALTVASYAYVYVTLHACTTLDGTNKRANQTSSSSMTETVLRVQSASQTVFTNIQLRLQLFAPLYSVLYATGVVSCVRHSTQCLCTVLISTLHWHSSLL
jgi:hypothetical protein